MTLKRFGLAAIAIIALGAVAAVAQVVNNAPIVGGASYCAGYSSGPTGQVCTNTVPAGPSGLTGAETIPAATNLSGGRAPQVVNIPSRMLGGGATQYVVATDGSSTTVAAGTGKLVLDPAGTLTTATIVLPASTSLYDGQTLEVSSSQTITGLTVTAGSGTTISNAPTALTISTTGTYGYKFIYYAAGTKWFRQN